MTNPTEATRRLADYAREAVGSARAHIAKLADGDPDELAEQLLGAAAVVVAGIVALRRRDGRSTALLAAAVRHLGLGTKGKS